MNLSNTIIVTGARGLVGSAVVRHLRLLGYFNVVGLSRLNCDLRDFAATAAVFACLRPRHVFHAAACVFGLGGNLNNQGRSYLENTLINTSVIDAARTSGAKKITVMGTNAVYPWPHERPICEDTVFNGRPHAGEAGYAHAKRGMLAMLEVYAESYGLEWCYLVSGNLYGPRDKFNLETGHVLPTMILKFYKALESGGQVNLWGDGSPQRDFLYSKDLAEIVRVSMDRVDGVMNTGSGTIYSIRQIAEKLSVISGVPMARVVFDPTKPNGRMNCEIDLTRLNTLGCRSNYSIDRGLQETWDWYVKCQSILAH
jgi:GDP-L-fucose synthase